MGNGRGKALRRGFVGCAELRMQPRFFELELAVQGDEGEKDG